MTILHRFRHRPTDIARHSKGQSVQVKTPASLTWGSGLSVALTVTFYLLVLAADAEFDVGNHLSSNTSSAVQAFAASAADSSTGLAATTITSPTTAARSTDHMLAQAHQCASAGQWDCVFDATTRVMALRGETPETLALLQQAMNGTSAAPSAPKAPVLASNPRSTRPGANGYVRPTRYTRHIRKHSLRATLIRYSFVRRAASANKMDDLYRH
ncbi:MAG: hypothetical protein EPN70_21015 [Paraburkholderia sp.]|uniref:hypothetical protein n=1 Tax=Paraburkholderia sp. TaxID=1926495 RepID=UPI00121C4F18|nr:hypothetical protein [Paraburkholderia sp.]TAM00888.1 MAG: hypothetical protein EPN70_21015 [Paraburkholderia sp.]TAM31548.1 MAG: hypothetical protein EPN59_05260 [Paraburkholderia sp.]